MKKEISTAVNRVIEAQLLYWKMASEGATEAEMRWASEQELHAHRYLFGLAFMDPGKLESEYNSKLSSRTRDPEELEETRKAWNALAAGDVPERARTAKIAERRGVPQSTIDKQIVKMKLRTKPRKKAKRH